MMNWILLRGLTRESRHWGSFPQSFREQVPNANPVMLDLPGNGRLNAMKSPTTVARMTAHCRAELARGGVTPPYYLLAMSLGAMVAVDWATNHADEIGGCVLINTSLRPFSPFYRRLRPQSYGLLLKLMLTGGTDRQREEVILRLTSTRKGAHAEVLDRWATLRRDDPVSPSNALRQLWAASRYKTNGDIPAPRMLILTSDKDELVDTRCSRALSAAWKASFAAHPVAGHDLPLDDREWVIAQVARWLRPMGESNDPSPSSSAVE